MAVESSTGESEWSDEQAIEALGEAGRSEFGDPSEQAQPEAPAPPEGETQPADEVQPEPEVAPQVEETFDSGKFNPDELPPELQDGWKQLQAAFTQKTQELAAQRSQLEALGDPESLQQAVDLYSRIADPQNWQQLHSELTQAMQQMGMTPAEAQAAATEAVQEAAKPEATEFDFEDPALEPLAKQLQETQARLDQIESQRAEELANAEAERLFIQSVTELQKQEAAIRDAHPDWGDDKLAAAYELSSFYGGNLAQGAARLEQITSAERELYLSQKAGTLNDSTRTPASNFSEDSTKTVEPETLRDAESAAVEEIVARLAELDQ
jgi:hypothetical protein